LSRTLEFHLQGNVGWSVGAMVPAERKEAIVEVVARHVEIRDYSGDVVSRPPTGEGGRESNVVAPSHGKYSPFQFDILTLLFLMIVVAAFAGWYGILFRRSKATAEQKTHFQEKYEAVEYREYGNGITSLDFSKCKKEFTDDDLAEVATCSQLESLYFPLNTSITDAGLARLEGLTSLEYLSVSGNGITDAGLVHLYGLKKLKSLRFYYTRITPQGIEKLQKELPDTEISNTASISNIF
jgi:hypothetical protein